MTDKRRWVAVAIMLILLMAGCNQTNDPADAPSDGASGGEKPTLTIIGEINALYRQLDTSPLPRRADSGWQTMTVDKLPPQLATDDPRALELALHIRKGYLYAYGNLFDSDFPDGPNRSAILQTALYHTPAIDMGEWGTSGSTYTNRTHPNHVLTYLMSHETAEGRTPSDLFYWSDVEAFVEQYYGDVEVMHLTPDPPYMRHEREGVYSRIGDFGGPMWRYPQITAIEETDDGLICEAVLVWALDRDEPMKADGGLEITLTPENFTTATADMPHYRYTFVREDDGRLVLRAFDIL